ncbi:hypothetical protein M758_12G136200 [Ceratodon purpureus]|nr:hypothetical protein M758_12G136200 [Ceratodon purpureus]
MARASRESWRTAMVVCENWGARVRVNGGRVYSETSHLALRSSARSSVGLVSVDSGVQPESRDSITARGPLNEDSASISGSLEGGSHGRIFNQGLHRKGAGVKLDARQGVYTLHPSSRTSIRSTSFNTLPCVRITGTPKHVVYHKKGIHQPLLAGPNASLLPRSLIRMAFSTRPESVAEARNNSTPAGRSIEIDNQMGLHYTRHGKEFMLGVRGSREDVENIKSRIANFLKTELHLEVSLASHVHIQAGTVEFLGTRVAGLLDNKVRRRFSKEIEKRRRSKVRAQGEARIRTETWHNELKDLAVQSWAFGLKKVRRDLESWKTAQQVLYKRSQELRGGKFVPEQIDRSVTKETIQRLLDKEEEVFMDAPGTGLPQQILRAQQRLTRLLKKHLDEEIAYEKKANSALQARSQLTKTPRKEAEADDDDSIPIQLLAPMEHIMEKLSVKGILQPSKALPTVVTPMLDSSDEAIVSYFTALGTCLLSYYRCCDNFEKIRRLVDHQVRWSALFTLGRKHGCSARKIMRQFSRGPKIVDPDSGRVVVEFPSSPDIARTGKKFLVNVQHHSLDEILRSRPVQLQATKLRG